MKSQKIQKRVRRKKNLRARIFGTLDRPRLTVYRSIRKIYAQIINDETGKTIVSASSSEIKTAKSQSKVEIAGVVGESLALKAVKAKIKKVSFDKNGFMYHGRVKALADGARKGGLDF